ncbi:MAG TPA: TrkA family potassium uptake protein [Gaiellaceae bacterium]|nr:TrkA family potassium uptake protein [Gaiellaceae bacterium]
MSASFRLRQGLRILVAFVAALTAGTVGFHALTHEGWLSSVYRAVVTTTLTGLDTVPTGDGALVLTIVLVLAGLAIIAYAGAVIVEGIAGGVLTGALTERRRVRAIDRLSDHYIICGYGRVGRRVAEEFRHAAAAYVVLDRSEAAIAAANERGDLLVHGDATDDTDLLRAGIERARGLVAAADSDVDNLYVVLSAKASRPELTIVARASDRAAEQKLLRAGADRVVLPYATAGVVMANLVLRPQVTAFLDTVMTAVGPDLQLAEVEVQNGCPVAGRTIRELRIRHETGAIVIALRKRDGSFDTTPEPDSLLEVGDVLIGVGAPDEILRLEDLFASDGARAV